MAGYRVQDKIYGESGSIFDVLDDIFSDDNGDSTTIKPFGA